MSEIDLKKLYEALSAPFPESCVQRTEGRLTGRGYDTTGIGDQHIANRLCSVVGVGGFRAHRTVTVKEFTRSNGKQAFEAICDLTLELGRWIDGQFVTFAEALADGGHVAASEADARKGAYTNAFKKAAAFFGVGRQAYEGTLDDDSLPSDDAPTTPMTTVVRAPAPVRAVATPPAAPPRAQTQSADRGRISSKQVAAIMSISRKLGTDPAALRSRVKTQFNCQLEFLSREQASLVISSLQAQLNGNHADPPGESLAS